MPWKRAPSCATGPLGWESRMLATLYSHLARRLKSNVGRVCVLFAGIVVYERFGLVGTVGAVHPAAVSQTQEKARGEDLAALLVQRVIDARDWLSDHGVLAILSAGWPPLHRSLLGAKRNSHCGIGNVDSGAEADAARSDSRDALTGNKDADQVQRIGCRDGDELG